MNGGGLSAVGGAHRHQSSNLVVAGICDVKRSSIGPECDPAWRIQGRTGRQAAITRESSDSVSRDLREESVRGANPANSIKVVVTEKYIVKAVHYQARRAPNGSAGCQSSVRRCGQRAIARDGGDQPAARRYLSDAPVAVVGDIQIVRRVKRKSVWGIQLRGGGRSVVSGIAGLSGASGIIEIVPSGVILRTTSYQ